MADDKKLGRIIFTNDEERTPVAADESDRLPDPYLSPPGVTPGSVKTYIALAAAGLALAAAATLAWHYCKGEPAKEPARYLPRD